MKYTSMKSCRKACSQTVQDKLISFSFHVRYCGTHCFIYISVHLLSTGKTLATLLVYKKSFISCCATLNTVCICINLAGVNDITKRQYRNPFFAREAERVDIASWKLNLIKLTQNQLTAKPQMRCINSGILVSRT